MKSLHRASQLPLVEVNPCIKEKEKNSTSVYEEVAVTTQMGHPSILPLELVPPRLIPVCVV